MKAIPTPESVKSKGDDGVELVYDELVARDGQTFVFLDKVFWSPNLSGATGSRMVPVGPEEFARRLEELEDPEFSPIRHLYEERVSNGLDKSWSEWVGDIPQREKQELVFDPSYSGKYGPTVREKTDGDVEVVECVGGGRIFNDVDRSFDEVYRPDLLELIKDAESENPEWHKAYR